MPYVKGFIFILMKRYVYPSQAQASLTFVTVPSATSAFKLSFKELINCNEGIRTSNKSEHNDYQV